MDNPAGSERLAPAVQEGRGRAASAQVAVMVSAAVLLTGFLLAPENLSERWTASSGETGLHVAGHMQSHRDV